MLLISFVDALRDMVDEFLSFSILVRIVFRNILCKEVYDVLDLAMCHVSCSEPCLTKCRSVSLKFVSTEIESWRTWAKGTLEER